MRTPDDWTKRRVSREQDTDPHTILGMTQRWLTDRAYLRAHRRELTELAARHYPGVSRVGASQLLTRAEWMPVEPVPLASIKLAWRSTAPPPPLPEEPLPAAGFTRYSQAVAALDPPRVLVDRPTYRLLSADLVADPTAAFTLGRYFDVLDIGEAAAHEFAAAVRTVDHDAPLAARLPEQPPERSPSQISERLPEQPPERSLSQISERLPERLPLRRAIGDPTDPARRPMAVAVTALTIRNDAPRGDARFLVHWRDPARVATNHGMYTTIPVGVFQPSGSDEAAAGASEPGEDFDLWRGIAREYGEELLGDDEHRDVDYERWPFFTALERFRSEGACRPYCLGLGVDPLTLAVDLLVAVVFESEAFDALFAGMVATNDEGRTTTRGPDGTFGIPFTQAEVQRLVGAEHTQPASAAVLDASWRARAALLEPRRYDVAPCAKP